MKLQANENTSGYMNVLLHHRVTGHVTLIVSLMVWNFLHIISILCSIRSSDLNEYWHDDYITFWIARSMFSLFYPFRFSLDWKAL